MESGAERKCETVFHMGHPALHTAVLGKHIVGANNVRPELLRQACGLPPPLGEETFLLAPLTGHPKGVPCAELASRRLD